MKKAFITGIGGQDGSYLAEYLIELGYKVYGIIRRNSIPEHQQSRIEKIRNNPNLKVMYGDLIETSAIERILREVKPDEIYNLGAQSHVRISFDVPKFTAQTNAIGVLNMLEAIRSNCPDTRFYQASSSEMFGLSVEDDNSQRESTPMNPVSPYGCSKVFGYNITRNYRRAYGMFASNGILFNHESPRRGSNFVTTKVVKAAVRIKFGLQERLELGNMDSYRDWGHSKDYIKAMHLILQHDKPDDFVVSTGKTFSVRQMCEYVFNSLDMDYKDYVYQNPKFLRPEELPYLKGDSTKIRTKLGWEPYYSFESLMDEMIDYYSKIYNK